MSWLSSRIHRPLCLIVALFLTVVFQPSAFAQPQTDVLLVDGDDGLPLGDGETWPTAFEFLQDALTEAQFRVNQNPNLIVQIWVAEWTYHPDESAANPGGDGDRDASFALRTDVEIYGGFMGNDGPNGGETALSERDLLTNITTLSGEVTLPEANDPVSACTDPDPNAGDCFTPTPGIPGCTDERCCDIVCDLDPFCCITGWDGNCVSLAEANCEAAYHVVTANHTEPSARLDGFTLTGGVANGGGNNGRGGGVWFNGAGFQAGPVGVTIANCQFDGNFAIDGGGLFSDGTDSVGVFPKLINCTFMANEAQNRGGGAASTFASRIQWVNCLFSGNTAGNDGGGLFSVQGTNFDLINCTFHGNTATNGDGGGVYFDQSGATIDTLVSNGIFWANQDSGGIDTSAQIFLLGSGQFLDVRYSDIEGGPDPRWDGGNNINQAPIFGPGMDNFRLAAGSPGIDEGNNADVPCDAFDVDDNGEDCGAPAQDTPDLDLEARIVDGDSDSNDDVDMGAYELAPCLGDLNGDCEVGVADLLLFLAAWGPCADCDNCPADFDGNCTVGVPDLLLFLAAWGPCKCNPNAEVLSLEEELDDACLTQDDWDEYEDVMTDPESSQEDKDRYDCWMTHYLDHCNKCTCTHIPMCPGPDPFS